MKVLILVLCALVVCCVAADADSTTMQKNTFGIEWDTNYYGNSVRISARRHLGDKFSVGLGYARGSIYFTTKDGQSFYTVDYGDFEELNTNIDISSMLDLSLYYSRQKNRRWDYLTTVGFGVSHYNINFMLSELVVDQYERYYLTGSKVINGFAACASVDFLEYRPQVDEHFYFSLGSRAHVTRIDLPQEITLSAGYHYRTLTETSGGRQHLVIVIPEMTLRFNYIF